MTPQTPTGKRLSKVLFEYVRTPDEDGENHGWAFRATIADIEAEAARQERERLRAALRALWNSDAVFASTRELWDAFFALLPEETP